MYKFTCTYVSSKHFETQCRLMISCFIAPMGAPFGKGRREDTYVNGLLFLCVSRAVDCAGIVLKCLFCQFYDMILMVPASCERAANHCCPSYKQVVSMVPPTPSSEDESYMDMDCGLLTSCKDASDCLELAMEVSEICYH
uniref:Uncharacterized protein n=1 Tax=Sphaeramia orbicularis TaxID=375764 RepID=A0A673C4E0_9TELE